MTIFILFLKDFLINPTSQILPIFIKLTLPIKFTF